MKSHVEAMIFGGLIVLFLAIEPRGLARLWAIGKEKTAHLGHFHIDRPDRATAPKETPYENDNAVTGSAGSQPPPAPAAWQSTAAAEDRQGGSGAVHSVCSSTARGRMPRMAPPGPTPSRYYIKLINARDGGVNGAQADLRGMDETEYKTDRGVDVLLSV